MHAKTKSLITHLIANKELPMQLRTLHDLALYESGDALLGEEEKEALRVTQELAGFLEEAKLRDLLELL